MARVLLINPPSPTTGRPVLRDYSCGETTKADYLWAPVDLLVLSGVLDDAHEISVLDAVAEDLAPDAALRRAVAMAPEAVFSLTAAVSLEDDDAFLGALKRETGARVYGIGDVASFAPVETLARKRSFDGKLGTETGDRYRFQGDRNWGQVPIPRANPARYRRNQTKIGTCPQFSGLCPPRRPLPIQSP